MLRRSFVLLVLVVLSFMVVSQEATASRTAQSRLIYLPLVRNDTAPSLTVETVAPKGMSPSVAIDAGKQPHIAFINDFVLGSDSLTYASRDGMDWTTTVIPDTTAALYPVLRIDDASVPHIAFIIGNSVKYATLDGETWTVDTVDGLQTDRPIDLVLNGQGVPYIADAHNVAHLNGDMWTLEALPFDTTVVPALAFDSNGILHLAYISSATSSGVAHAIRTGNTWQTENVPTASGFGGEFALDRDNAPAILSSTICGEKCAGDGVYTHKMGDAWSRTIFGAGYSPSVFSLAFDSQNVAHIAFRTLYNETYYVEIDGTTVRRQPLNIPNTDGSPTLALLDDDTTLLAYASRERAIILATYRVQP